MPTVGLGDTSSKSALAVEVATGFCQYHSSRRSLKVFPGDGARNEMSTRQCDMAIVVENTLSVTNILLEYFAATFPMVTPTEMTMVVARCRGRGFGLRCRSTRRTELGNGLFHHVD